ncbi:MAG: preprotein translocase subunit SecY [Pyrinomonadaceae bacterium]|jgi:preprotein translocase subunit SecY|nr:preprotein translocase subunit SecY [Pyrinomonadaceae bacterium]MDQ1728571.1 preprotein translocase subunit SecY [Pyrinomonadaceae bacterium]
MDKFLAAIRNMFSVPDLRRRILFTLGMLAVYRLGAHIGAPGINKDKLDQVWSTVAGTLLGVLDLFSGGNFRTISIFALGVTPYITASIILQLMTVVSPQLKKLQEEGEMGRQKINQWTRYLTVGLAGIQTSFVAHWLQANQVGANTWGFLFTTVLTLTTGTIFVMWLGEQITDRGVGNGISLLIFAGIVIGLPRGVIQVSDRLRSGDTLETLGVFALVAALVLIIAFIVFVEAARRKVPVSYAKRHVGRQLVGGQQTTMPLKINMGGVIPVIFASSVLSMPQSLFAAFPPDPNQLNSTWGKIWTFFQNFHASDPYYELIFLSLIVFFTFFYVSIVFNVEEVADNLRKHGGFMPGIRPGRATAEYLNSILTRLTVVGAVYLALVAFGPQFMLSGFKVARLPLIGNWLDAFVTSTPGLTWIPTGMGYQFYFGGTSLLILVGVAMDTVAQIEAQLVMRNYEGFLGGGGRLRGRRA